MNCEEFEAIVGELARGRGLEDSVRGAATAHARDCTRCAARLVEEWELAGILERYAATIPGRGAPRRVEAALLEAFDRRHASKPAGRRSFTLPRWAFAAAAMVALAAAAAVLLRPRPVVAPSVAVNHPAVAPSPKPVAPAPAATPVAVRSASPQRSRPSRRQVATRFYPLTPADGLADIQGGAIVRIGMPRAALASFGLPVDPDNSGGRIEAEVVLDSDTGMARAIRFVPSRQRY